MENNTLRLKFVCVNCFDELFTFCYSCNDVIFNDDSYQGSDNYDYCETCFNETFSECYSCNDVIFNDDSYQGSDNYDYCETCFNETFFTCDGCSETYHRDNMHYNDDDGYAYCTDCYNETFFTCDGCSETYHRDNMHYNDDDGYAYCTDCYNETCNECSGFIHSYDYKPEPEFYRTSKDKMKPMQSKLDYFGTELETENISCSDMGCVCEKILNDLGFIYLKNDGSLDNGFEIVTHPLSYNYILKNKKAITETLNYLKTSGMRSYNTTSCGMHIHISKNNISNLSLYKMLKLFYENTNFILKISGRTQHAFDAWCTLKDDVDCNKLVIKAKNKNSDMRCIAINLQNEHTIEFRIFRGTLHPKAFFKNIEFIKSLIDYSRLTSIENISKNNFKDFIYNNKKEFFNLYTFIKDKNL